MHLLNSDRATVFKTPAGRSNNLSRNVHSCITYYFLRAFFYNQLFLCTLWNLNSDFTEMDGLS